MKSFLLALYIFFAFLIFGPIKNKIPKPTPPPLEVPLIKEIKKPKPSPIPKTIAREKASIILGKNDSKKNAIIIVTKVSEISVDVPLTMVKLKEDGKISNPTKISPENLKTRFSKVMNAIPLKAYHVNLFFNQGTQLKEDSQYIMGDIILEMKKREPCILEIKGYSDTFGNYEDNQRISENRALYIKELLQVSNITISSINTAGLGESSLFISTEDEVKEEKNRRVEITIR